MYLFTLDSNSVETLAKISVKGTVSVISSDSPCKAGNVRLPTVKYELTHQCLYF